MMDSSPDIQIVEATSMDEFALNERAKAVCEVLSKTYPNHLWQVGWTNGQVLVVKNALIGGGKYGYTIDNARLTTQKDLVRVARLAGGELLERCGMKRGAWDGEQQPGRLEGADPKHIPTI
jgi:hypothetical protein